MFGEVLTIFLILQELISYNERLILSLFDWFYDFLLWEFEYIFEVHLFYLLINRVIKLKLRLFLHEERPTNTIINRNMTSEPRMILYIVYFDPLCRVHLQHPRNQIFSWIAEPLGHDINPLLNKQRCTLYFLVKQRYRLLVKGKWTNQKCEQYDSTWPDVDGSALVLSLTYDLRSCVIGTSTGCP